MAPSIFVAPLNNLLNHGLEAVLCSEYLKRHRSDRWASFKMSWLFQRPYQVRLYLYEAIFPRGHFTWRHEMIFNKKVKQNCWNLLPNSFTQNEWFLNKLRRPNIWFHLQNSFKRFLGRVSSFWAKLKYFNNNWWTWCKIFSWWRGTIKWQRSHFINNDSFNVAYKESQRKSLKL